jgi:hypothetical protein
MGYFLQRAGRDYVILERGAQAGSFFTVFPRHDQLISINKRHTGKSNAEFNLRHDWNSLISDDPKLKFGLYSRQMFPRRQQLVRYLNDFATTLNLRLRLNTDVGNVTRRDVTASSSCDVTCGNSSATGPQHEKDGGGKEEGKERNTAAEARFTMNDQHGNVFACRTLMVATGMWQPYTPHVEGEEFFEGYETVSINPEDFEGQTVLILGRGNSAFEVAQQIYGSTNLIHMLGRSRVRLSWSTHYVGDLRAVNNVLLDTYQLKSLDAVLEAPIEKLRIRRQGKKFYIEAANSNRGRVSDNRNSTISRDTSDTVETRARSSIYDNFPLREPYDRIIRCLGFEFNQSLFAPEMRLSLPKGTRQSKYPKIDFGYESVDYPNLYIIGTASHSLDLRKSAGGFIHGFRYTSRALHRMLEWKNHGVAWPAKSGPTEDLLTTILKRINEASGIYQMFGMLGDVVLLRGATFDYLEEFPVNLLHELPQRTGRQVDRLIVVMLEYGHNFSGPGYDVFRIDRAVGDPWLAHRSNFLHPVLYYYDKLPTAAAMSGRRRSENLPRPARLHHIVEDFLTTWDAPLSHILPLRRFLDAVLDEDVRSYFADSCLTAALTHFDLPLACRSQFLQGQGLERPISFRSATESLKVASVR